MAPKHVLEPHIYKLSIHLFGDFYFQNVGNVQDGVFRFFYAFFEALELLILLFLNMVY
jgi:hypothetical protein